MQCPQESEKDLGPLELEFQKLVNYHVGAGNKTLILRERSVLLTAELLYIPDNTTCYFCETCIAEFVLS